MRRINIITYFKKISFIFSVLLSLSGRAELIVGNAQEGSATSFTFPLQAHIMTKRSDAFFVGAYPNIAGIDSKEYALSFLSPTGTSFIPLAPQEVTLNQKAVDPNPIYNKGINFLAVMPTIDESGLLPSFHNFPVVVTDDDLKTIYVLNNFSNPKNISMLSATNIKDATIPVAQDTSGIVGVAAERFSVFAAVRPGGLGNFGDAGSGIAFFALMNLVIEDGDDRVIKTVLQQINTAPLDVSSAAVRRTTGDNLLDLNVLDMYWDDSSKRLYIALDVTAGVNAGSGACAVVVGYVNANAQLVLTAIAPEDVFVGSDKIVGTGETTHQVSIHKVRTMFTSNWSNYLIVLGGNVELPNKTKRTVFALPLVSDPTSASNGLLAAYDTEREDLFTGEKERLASLWSRRYITPATQAGDVLTTASSKAKVGRGEVPGDADIVDVIIKDDAVFVVVEKTFNAGQIKRRIYSSTALFDKEGRIKDWTEWKPVAGAEGKIFGAAINGDTGNIITMSNDDGVDDDEGVKSVRRTSWSSGQEGGLETLVNLLASEFPQELGGIHGLFDFSENTAGISDATFAIATGRQKIVLIETARNNLGEMNINKGDIFDAANVVSFSSGTITQTFVAGGDTRAVVLSGGVLDDIGAIESATISKGNSTRLFVGGPGGLASLVQANGLGIADPGLKIGFEGLVNGMLFQKIGDYSFVRKLVADGDFLYVLTDKKLDRIDLTDNNFTAITLATTAGLGLFSSSALTDIVVSGKLCFLATSFGLFRTGNGNDISLAASEQEVGWTGVTMPDNSGPVQQLIFMAKDGALVNGGNLYVLNAYIGENKARLNRFSVTDVSATAIDDSVIYPFPDGFIEQKSGGLLLSYFANYGNFKNLIADDGALRFFVNEKNLEKDPALRLLSSGIRTALRLAAGASHSVAVNLDDSSDVVRLIRSSASGDLLLATDVGLRVNE